MWANSSFEIESQKIMSTVYDIMGEMLKMLKKEVVKRLYKLHIVC